MCDKKLKRNAAAILSVCIVVCGVSWTLTGCTRREQLVLEAAGSAEQSGLLSDCEAGNADQERMQTGGGEQTDQGQTRDGEQTGQGQDRSGQQTGQGQTRDGEQTGQGQTQDGQQTDPGRFLDGTGSAGEGVSAGERQKEDAAAICVHVCGAVRKAGVYELPAGSRVYEAVSAAGGFAADADESYVNQAQRLSDGSKLVIPTVQQVEEAAADSTAKAGQIGIVEQAAMQGDGSGASAGTDADADPAGTASAAADGRIDINTASESQLCEIPGIGSTRAAAIVAYRQEHGGFSSIEEIMNVSGIKEGTYAKIKDHIKVK